MAPPRGLAAAAVAAAALVAAATGAAAAAAAADAASCAETGCDGDAQGLLQLKEGRRAGVSGGGRAAVPDMRLPVIDFTLRTKDEWDVFYQTYLMDGDLPVHQIEAPTILMLGTPPSAPADWDPTSDWCCNDGKWYWNDVLRMVKKIKARCPWAAVAAVPEGSAVWDEMKGNWMKYPYSLSIFNIWTSTNGPGADVRQPLVYFGSGPNAVGFARTMEDGGAVDFAFSMSVDRNMERYFMWCPRDYKGEPVEPLAHLS